MERGVILVRDDQAVVDLRGSPMEILIATSSFGKHSAEPLDLLKSNGLDIKTNPLERPLTEEEVVRLAGGCVGIIAGTEPYSESNLSRLPQLKTISRCGVGLDGIDLDTTRKMGISVTYTPEAPTQAVAELTLGLILGLVRHIGSSNVQIKKGAWKKQMGRLLEELCIGVIGLGRIGRRVAGLLRGLDVRVIGCDIQPDHSWAHRNGVGIVGKEEVLRESDVLCLHLPYSKEAHHLIGENEMKIMKAGSFLVNASRGGLVDEDALYYALKSGQLAGAALDTFEREPYEGPLRELENVILTPHIGSYARAGRIKMEIEAAQNLLRELARLDAVAAEGKRLAEAKA